MDPRRLRKLQGTCKAPPDGAALAPPAEGKGAPLLEDSGSARLLLPLPEKAGLERVSAAPLAPRSAKRPFLPLRPAGAPSGQIRRPGPARLSSARLGDGGVLSAEAPTLWRLSPSAQPQGRLAPEAAAMPGM